VIGGQDGPTTKADCLNRLWTVLLRDEVSEGRQVAAILLHDAEDVVHPGELRVVADQMRDADVVQLPVVPLVDPQSRLISGHYLDEFAEAHGKQLLVRQAIGAAMPLAGVGCAIARPMLGRVADARGGLPFDAESLTEDYELGLTLGAMGARTRFARVTVATSGGLVAVRAFFPGTLDAAVRQKTRWMIGIALAGWDRTGWARAGAIGDHWMRMRDRRAIVAVMVLAAAYLGLVAWAVLAVLHWLGAGEAPALPETMVLLLKVNAALLLWRLLIRAIFVGRAAGWREALLSVPRMVVADLITLMAARRAVARYVGMLRGREVRWDKTVHKFPDLPVGVSR
jgi:adsorption protein B